jgi:hypothetical protein
MQRTEACERFEDHQVQRAVRNFRNVGAHVDRQQKLAQVLLAFNMNSAKAGIADLEIWDLVIW